MNRIGIIVVMMVLTMVFCGFMAYSNHRDAVFYKSLAENERARSVEMLDYVLCTNLKPYLDADETIRAEYIRSLCEKIDNKR